MDVLFEYRGSRRQLEIAEKGSITRVVSSELRRVGKPRAQVFTASDDLPSSGGDIYLLQRWSSQWDCYVDVSHCNEVIDGDKLAVIAKPKPRSGFSLLCCCGSDSSYRTGKVGGSGKMKIPKTEEIQSLEYRFRAESEAGSILEESSAVQEENSVSAEAREGEQYIRAESGRAAWKLVKTSASAEDIQMCSPSAEESERAGSVKQEHLGSGEGVEEGAAQDQDMMVTDEKGKEGGDSNEGEEGSAKREEEKESVGTGEQAGDRAEEEEVATSQEDGDDELKDSEEPSVSPTTEEGAVEGVNAEDIAPESSEEESNTETTKEPTTPSPSHDNVPQSHDNIKASAEDPSDDTAQTPITTESSILDGGKRIADDDGDVQAED